MNWLPGWNSIENAGWWSSLYFWIGIVCLIASVSSSVLTYIYSSRRESLVAIEQTRVVVNLKKQLEKTDQQVIADHSLKNRIRNLLFSIDPQILRDIDKGEAELTIRMQPSDIESLKKLLAESDGENLIIILEQGQKMTNSLINNGTLGPQGVVPLQEKIIVKVLPTMRIIN
jgi:predicted DNA binding CopG/RHH family protein